MSKALVINGANFSINKLDTVTIGDITPCTGISLSESAISFSAIGETQQLTATVTPVDTTDAITWGTSDSNVVAVEDGLVTCIGIGTASVTAICGEQTASCSVTVAVVMNVDTDYTNENGYVYSGTDLPTKDYVGSQTDTRGRIYYNSENTLSGYPLVSNHTSLGFDAYPIPIPNGASHISVPIVDNVRFLRLVALASDTMETYISGAGSAKVVAHVYADKNSGTNYAEFDLPDTADSFAFSIYTASGKTPEQVTTQFNVTFT